MGKLDCVTFVIYINCSEILTDKEKPWWNKTYRTFPPLLLFPAGASTLSWPPQKRLQRPR